MDTSTLTAAHFTANWLTVPELVTADELIESQQAVSARRENLSAAISAAELSSLGGNEQQIKAAKEGLISAKEALIAAQLTAQCQRERLISAGDQVRYGLGNPDHWPQLCAQGEETANKIASFFTRFSGLALNAQLDQADEEAQVLGQWLMIRSERLPRLARTNEFGKMRAMMPEDAVRIRAIVGALHAVSEAQRTLETIGRAQQAPDNTGDSASPSAARSAVPAPPHLGAACLAAGAALQQWIPSKEDDGFWMIRIVLRLLPTELAAGTVHCALVLDGPRRMGLATRILNYKEALEVYSSDQRQATERAVEALKEVALARDLLKGEAS